MKNCCQTKCKISSVAIEYDAMGREKSVADAKGVTAFAYDAYGALASETVSGLYSKILLHHRDTFGRDVGFTLDNSRKNIIEYSEDTGRLYRMKAGGAWFTWEYLAGTDLKSKLTYGASGNTTWEYEPQRDLLTRVRNFINGGVISQYDYANDALGRRTEMARSGSMMVATGADAYGYNTRDELVSAATGGAVQYAYQYDDIGNRITSSDLGANRIYSANELNQYTNILCNASPTLFNPAYDLDGNQTNILTSTGVWSVTYNGENRPVNWQCGATNIVMQFDRMGRRVECLETVGGATNRHERFVYNGYLCVQELNAANANAVAAQFVWDPTEKVATRPLFIYDMGASDNGTCGISGRVNGGYMFVTCDGNKNVSDVVHFSRAARIAAHYEYAPFGAVTAATTTSTITPRIVSANPFRFSSEYHDDTLGLVYYNYRHYNPIDGRWSSRDIIGELGGMNVYRFIDNSVSDSIDVLGLLDSNLQNYEEYDMTTEVKVLFGGGGSLSILSKRESGFHKCCGGQYDGNMARIVEWTVGANVSVGIGVGASFSILGVGFDFNITFASADADIAAFHIILDDCQDDTSVSMDLLNLKASPGVKEASIGLGWLAKGTLSVYGGFELNLGVNLSKQDFGVYGGIYFDYDFGFSGKFLARNYKLASIDDLAPHQRITLVEFGKRN